eukprot:m.153442 g.153442  ORF g.153442 m.153442 type:complete len:266 (-) comp14292_c0_seq1:68-865(-)
MLSVSTGAERPPPATFNVLPGIKQHTQSQLNTPCSTGAPDKPIMPQPSSTAQTSDSQMPCAPSMDEQSPQKPTPLLCTAVGDPGVGKSTMLRTYQFGEFYQAEAQQSVVERLLIQLHTNGKLVEVELLDTVGQAYFDRLRPLAYLSSQVFIACFSIGNPESLANIYHKWYPELTFHRPDVPIVLVGTQSDLRSNQQCIEDLASKRKRPVTVADGKRVQAKIRAAQYIECSALTRSCLQQVLEEAVRTALDPPIATLPPHKRCILL